MDWLYNVPKHIIVRIHRYVFMYLFMCLLISNHRYRVIMYTTMNITDSSNHVTDKHTVFSHHRKMFLQTQCFVYRLYLYTSSLWWLLTAGSGTPLFSVSQIVVEVTKWIFSQTCIFLFLYNRKRSLFTLHMQ